MGIRKLKPTTPGQRHKVIGAFDKITASTPETVSYTHLDVYKRQALI